MHLEALESRRLLAGAATIEARDFPFTFFGQYVGKNPGTYISLPSKRVVSYLDSFHGTLQGTGVVHYENNISGPGEVTFGNSPGSGSDNFWKEYAYDVFGGLFLHDSGGILQGNGKPGTTRVLREDSIEYFDPPTSGYGIKPLNPGGIPAELSGEWSPETYLISIYGAGPFDFHGSVNPQMSGSTAIEINDETLRAGYDCVCVEVEITGGFPRAKHEESVGMVKAEWLDGFGTSVGTVFEQPVYWNTGRVSYESVGAAPPEAVQLRVTATIDQATDVAVIDYAPDLAITYFDWGRPDGVKGSYTIQGADVDHPARIGLYWSSDGQYSEDDTLAYEFFTATEAKDEPYQFPRISGTDIAPPNREQSILVAMFHPQAGARECDEANNQRALVLLDRFDVSVTPLSTGVLRKEVYTVEYAVTNLSPVHIFTDISRSWATNVPITEQPELVEDTNELLKPGETYRWTDSATFAHDWKWVDDDPLYAPEDWQRYAVAIIQDALGRTPITKVINGIHDTMNYLLITLNEIQNIPSFPYADITHGLTVEPHVVATNLTTSTAKVLAWVGPEKIERLNQFKTQSANVASVLLGATFRSAILSELMGEVLGFFELSDKLWKSVQDPPDPDFRTFTAIVPPDGAFETYPAEVLRNWGRQSAWYRAFGDTALLAIDKHDGADLAGNWRWRAQQMVAAAMLLDQAVFAGAASADAVAFLQPWYDAELLSPSERIAYWQTHELPGELVDGLQALGAPPEFADELLSTYRNLTAEQWGAMDAAFATNSWRMNVLANAAQSITMLREAIALRVNHLGFEVRDLSAAEDALLQPLRDTIDQRTASDRFGGDFRQVARDYLSQVQRLLLLTNNYDALATDLDRAYSAVFNSAGNSTGTDNFILAATEHRESNALSAALHAQLTTSAMEVATAIRTEQWTTAVSLLDGMRTLLSSAAAADIADSARQRLIGFVDAMLETTDTVPVIHDPTLANIPQEVTLSSTNTSILGSSVTVSDSQLATYVGGRLALTLDNPPNSAYWMFDEGTPWVLVDGDEIAIHGAAIGKVVAAGPGELRIQWLADATAERVQQALRQLRLFVPESSQVWSSVLTLDLTNGVGGMSSVTLTANRPSGSPPNTENHAPTGISLNTSSVHENMPPETVVGTLLAQDIDVSDFFTFSLVDGAGDSDNERFVIVGNQLRTAERLNYEERSEYSIRVRVVDLAGASVEQQLHVQVTDVPDAPHVIYLSSDVIAENAAPGTSIGVLGASDEDAGETMFQFELVDAATRPENANFVLDGTTLKTAASFDFESEATYFPVVRVTDASGRWFEQHIRVQVIDVDEQPTDISLSTDVFNENLAIGTTIATLATSDVDLHQHFTYQLVPGAGATDNAAFVINDGKLQTAANFDFESKSTYSIRVRALDPSGLATEKQFLLHVADVNDRPTGLLLSRAFVPARSAVGTVVGTLRTVDPDAVDTFTYELALGEGSDHNYRFEIDGDQLRTAYPFEFGSDNDYSVRVRTIDTSGASLERSLTIVVSPDRQQVDVELITAASSGVLPAEGELGLDARRVSSHDGRYVVFLSRAEGLVAGSQSNGYSQVYVIDNDLGTVTLVSRAHDGSDGGSGDSYEPQISADGSKIAFLSEAPDLVAGATVSVASLYVYDTATGITTLASHRSDDPLTGINDFSGVAQLSLDGSAIAYSTYATDVIDGAIDDNFGADIYLYDVASNTNVLVTHRHNNPLIAADAETSEFAISGNGQYVALGSYATDLIAGVEDSNFDSDIYLYNAASNSIRLVSFSEANLQRTGESGAYHPSISYNGARVSYESYASDLVAAPDENFSSDVFLFDAAVGTNTLVSHRFGNTGAANGESWNAAISLDGTRIVYESTATEVVTGFEGEGVQLYAYDIASGMNRLVSRAHDDASVGANGFMSNHVISGDGRLVLFSSDATNLQPGLQNPDAELALYVHHLETGETYLVTHEPGAPAQVATSGYAASYGFSGDGSSVVLTTYASLDAEAAASNDVSQVYLYNVDTQLSKLLSRYGSSVTANGESKFADMSEDGRFIVFESDAANIVPGQVHTVGGMNVFFLDRQTGVVSLVSHAPGAPLETGYGEATNARISADGSAIVYEFYDYELFQVDVYLYDMATGVHTLVSHAAGSELPADRSSWSPRISDDGKLVVFDSQATDLVAGIVDDSSDDDIFIFDVETGVTKLVSHQMGNLFAPGNDYSNVAEISGNGSKVVFTSYATNLVSNPSDDVNDYQDVFVYDVATGTVSLVSHTSNAVRVTADDESSFPSISADGRWIAYESYATNISEGEMSDESKVYLYDVSTSDNRLVTHAVGEPLRAANDGAFGPRISANGEKVVYESGATDLVDGLIDFYGVDNIYVFDVQTGQNTLVSHIDRHPLAAANWHSTRANISGDGSTIVWMTDADDILSYVTDWNSGDLENFGFGDVYRYDVVTGRNTLLSRTHASDVDAGNGESTTGEEWFRQGRALSYDGSISIFDSLASDIVAGDENGRRDLFVVAVSELSPPRSSDVNMDGMADASDLDGLVEAIVAGSTAVEFDLTGDGAVTVDDLAEWLVLAGGENLPGGAPYLFGDSNLDGEVSGADFNAWSANRFSTSAAWTSGDFNADGVTDGADFNIWNQNKFRVSQPAEPSNKGNRTPRAALGARSDVVNGLSAKLVDAAIALEFGSDPVRCS